MTTIIFDEGSSPPKPLQRKQLLTHVVDGLARHQPNALYAEYPYSPTTYEDGFRKVTYSMLANAVNGLAWLIHDTLGPGDNFPTLAYVGGNDVRYPVLVLAAVKAGYKMLLTSPRNSIPAHQNLFKLTNCEVLVTSNPQPPFIKPILASTKLKVLEIPQVGELFSKTYPVFPYTKTFEEARNDPLVVLHTSGTTGLPKPITWTHDWAASYLTWSTLDVDEGFATELQGLVGTRMFLTLPPFHAAGVICILLMPIFMSVKVIMPLAGVFPSAQLVADGLKHTTADTVFLAPPFVVEMAKSPEMLEFITKKVDQVFYAGGAIPKVFGDAITAKTKLWNVIGMTEGGVLPGVRETGVWDTEDWNTLRFPEQSGVVFEDIGEGLYEAVVYRDQDPERVQPIFHVFPETNSWRTKDLYTKHPTKPGLWLYYGRADDIIVFLNGEKTNPASMEQHVSKHPEVAMAIVIGTLRLQAALLVELTVEKPLSTAERAAMIEKIWPVVEEANIECPHHAKVSKSHIMFTNPETPMLRSGKGTIQRQPTLDLYVNEVNSLYSDADKVSTPDEVADLILVDASDGTAVSALVHESVSKVLGGLKLESGDDFLAAGMDSLQALQLTRSLKKGLGLPDFDVSIIFLNPSIAKLSQAIANLAAQSVETKLSKEASRSREMESVLEKYNGLVSEAQKQKLTSGSNGIVAVNGTNGVNGTSMHSRTILLTGSTGALGCYLLEKLVNDPSISHIYCLNRSFDPLTLQLSQTSARGLQISLPSPRVTLLTSDFSKPDLGLDAEVYAQIQKSATDIIHNAWPVNFNLPLSSFTPQLAGVVNLIALAASSVHAPSFTFISSISSVASSTHLPIPEAVVKDMLASMPTGYGESKLLAERILDHAAITYPKLSINIVRVGQIAGPAAGSGVWNKAEWFPSLVLSSLHLGVIPETLGSEKNKVDWIPIDVLASVLIEITSTPKQDGGARYFHPQNPKPVAWSELLPAAVKTLSASGKPIKAVPFKSWLQAVRADAETLGDGDLERMLKANPAIKLLGFYESLNEGLPAMKGEKALEASGRLRELEGVSAGLMQKWVKSWI